MIYNSDADGRYPLSTKEYEALRLLFASKAAFENTALKDRLQTIPGAWRDMRCVWAKVDKLLTRLLDTIPLKKLLALKRELKNTYCEMRIKGASNTTSNDCVYVSHQAIVRLIDRAMDMQCGLCEKSAEDCRKCQLFQDIAACFPYEIVMPKDSLCPFAGLWGLEEEK